MDAFIQNMHNKIVQECLCTEPKENPQEALRFAIAFEERIRQLKSFTWGNEFKKEPVFAIDNKGENPCTRCGIEFVQNHLMTCEAKNEKCRNCGIIRRFMRTWQNRKQRQITTSKSNCPNNGPNQKEAQCGARTMWC